jgi:hypothetical protein
MKRFHLGALVCFVLALLFYFLSWAPGMWVIAVIGVLFEGAAWVQVWAGPDEPFLGHRRR